MDANRGRIWMPPTGPLSRRADDRAERRLLEDLDPGGGRPTATGRPATLGDTAQVLTHLCPHDAHFLQSRADENAASHV